MNDFCPAVEVNDLTVAYDSKPVLKEICLELPRGMMTAVMGPNGAGKTTLIKAMLGLIPKAKGKIDFFPLDGKKPVIGYVPQNDSIDRDFPATVLDVVTMGCYGRLGWIRRPKKEDKDLAMEMLSLMGIEEYADRQISRLSGGQQQRVFIARALAQKADVYLMDEPFKGVDRSTERTIVSLLKKLRSDGKTVVAVHHDLSTAKEYFDWAALINVGVVASGSIGSVFSDENIFKAFGASLSRGAV